MRSAISPALEQPEHAYTKGSGLESADASFMDAFHFLCGQSKHRRPGGVLFRPSSSYNCWQHRPLVTLAPVQFPASGWVAADMARASVPVDESIIVCMKPK